MTTGRDNIHAAHSSSRGAGPQRLQTMALAALARAHTEPWCDPWKIALGLGRSVRAVTRGEERAILRHGCIDYLWVAELLETELNVFMGDALAVLDDAGDTRPSPGDVCRVAGYLALPDPNVLPELELTLQTHAPLAFLRDHQRRRTWDRWSASGVFVAVTPGKTIDNR